MASVPDWLTAASFALGSCSVTAMLLAGRGRASGFVIAICAQVIWLPYDIITRQYGFMLITAVAVPLYVRELRRRRR